MLRESCKNFAVEIHQEKANTVFVWILMPSEGSKNAVNATNGMFKAMTGQKMRTLDNLNCERHCYCD